MTARRTTYASAPKSHHLRELVEADAHKESQYLKRTDFGGPRQCMEEKGNVSAIEWTVGGNQFRIMTCARLEEPVRTRSIVRFAMRVPSYSAANRDDEYNVKTSNSSWPKIMSELREL